MWWAQPSPNCGNEEPHDPHPNASYGPPDCPGLDAEYAACRKMFYAVETIVMDYSLYSDKDQPDFKLYMHPAMYNALLKNMSFGVAGPGGANLSEIMEVPVIISTMMPPGGWWLVAAEGGIAS